MSEVQVYGQDQRNLATAGLEDFDGSALIVPRLRIDNDNGVLKNTLDGSTYDTLDVVLLGFVKQRIMWNSQMKDGDRPQCKSRNGKQGYPTLDAELDRHKFPWRDSNFTEANLANDVNGNKMLPCDTCAFSQWKGTRKEPEPPRCAEQYTLVLQGPEGENYLFTTQRTSLRPAKTYIAGFIQKNKPAYSRFTKIGVTMVGGSQRRYGVPKFEAFGETDGLNWDGYADAYYRIREFLIAPPRNRDANEADGSANLQQAATASTAVRDDPRVAQAASPVVEAEVVSSTVTDDDLPF